MKSIVSLFSLVFLVSFAVGGAVRAEDVIEVDPDAVTEVAASDRATLMAMEGQVARVVGEVSRVGSTPTGSVTFLNFTPGEDQFVAVVFQRELGMFPDGFDHLNGKRVAVIGTIKIYREETPQIELGTASQIEILESSVEESPESGSAG
ncbi:MAG: OB-fold nucleic acid binding domain-containing protein [Chthoniobacterales bacterium]